MNAYFRIARPDHWIKNIFVLPGILLAAALGYAHGSFQLMALGLGIISTCLAASANYTINEFLDREFDRHHPQKRSRPGAQGELKREIVFAQYAVLSVASLVLGWAVNRGFFIVVVWLLVMGVLYNVKPFRTKDRVYLDVLSESINNPIRLLLGWFMMASEGLPPSSILMSYWMGGAFLMAAKRFSEYRMIGDSKVAGAYRRSFRYYTEESLLLSLFFYAITSAFFLGIFLIKYRIEFLITFPFFAILFVLYLRMSFRAQSAAQAPEKLYREKGLLLYVAFLAALVGVLFFVDLPWLQLFQEPLK